MYIFTCISSDLVDLLHFNRGTKKNYTLWLCMYSFGFDLTVSNADYLWFLTWKYIFALFKLNKLFLCNWYTIGTSSATSCLVVRSEACLAVSLCIHIPRGWSAHSRARSSGSFTENPGYYLGFPKLPAKFNDFIRC